MASMHETGARVALWDNLKLLLILFVVLGHFVDVFSGENGYARSLYFFIYTFHMPLFLFIAGLFHKDELWRCPFYLTLGYLLKILFFVVYRVVGQPAEFSLFSEYDIPWFAFALGIFTLLAYLFRNRDKKKILVLFLVLACIAGYDRATGDYLIASRVLVFFPFYLLGSLIGPARMLQFREKYRKIGVPLAVVFLLLLAVVCIRNIDAIYKFRHLLSGRNPYTDEIRAYGFLARLVCDALAMAGGLAWIFLVPSRSLGVITKMGANTMPVFLLHWPVYQILNRLFRLSAWGSRGTAGVVAVLLIGVAVTAVLSYFDVLGKPVKALESLFRKRIKTTPGSA